VDFDDLRKAAQRLKMAQTHEEGAEERSMPTWDLAVPTTVPAICRLTPGDGALHKTPTLGALFMTFGATVFINKHVGVGATGVVALRSFPREFNHRSLFYSFDSIFRPASGSMKRFEPEFRAGLGGQRVSYFFDDQAILRSGPGMPCF